MLWGSYVKESRDRSPLSVHFNFVDRSSILGDANLLFKLHMTALSNLYVLFLIHKKTGIGKTLAQIVDVAHATLSELSNLQRRVLITCGLQLSFLDMFC
jgi:hypothetical protein